MKKIKNNNLANLGIATPFLIQLANMVGNRGGRSLTYDFSMLNDHHFTVRSMARYKKKFPRFRVMPKYMPGYDLYVFVFPFSKGTPTTVIDSYSGHEYTYFKSNPNDQKLKKSLFGGEDEIYPNFRTFYNDKFKYPKTIQINVVEPLVTHRPTTNEPWIEYDFQKKQLGDKRVTVKENREVFLNEEQGRVFEEIKRLAQNPTNKILICNPDPDDMFTPYMMMHELAETIIQYTVNIEYIDAKADDLAKIIKPKIPENYHGYDPNQDRYISCILPRNKNFTRWLNNPKYWHIIKSGSYGFDPFSADVNDNIADAFASLMSGKLAWLTPDNYPPLKHFILETYKDSGGVVFPESYEPLIQSYDRKLMEIIEILNDNQIFIG